MKKIFVFLLLFSQCFYISCESQIKSSESIDLTNDFNLSKVENDEKNNYTSKYSNENDTSLIEKFDATNSDNNIKLYLYSASADKYFYVNSSVNYDSDDFDTKLIKLLKTSPNNSLIKNIPDNVDINSLVVDNDTLIIDLSHNFISESNFGSGIESSVLQCIANTAGEAKNVEKVIITLNGSPYESSHIIMEPGDYFTVNTKNIQQFKLK